MAVATHEILRSAAVRLNALIGTRPVSLEITYANLPLTDEVFQSSVFPFTSFLDQETASIARFATAIAETGNHPWRAYLVSETAPLSSGSLMPAVDVAGQPIIGIYGSVLDGTDDTIVCTEYPEQVIRRRNLNPGAWTIPVYGYKLSGDGIIHTRASVKVQVCTFNWNLVHELVVHNGNLPLPDALAMPIVYDMVGSMIRDDEFMPQAQAYKGYADNVEMAIRKGLTSVSEATMAGPSLIPA
jgi:hypothetical protein